MTEWIAIIISIVSFLFSIYTLYITNKKTNAQVEIEIKKMIDEKKQAFMNEMSDSSAKINYFIEEELNAYDKACSLYKDKKVDKKRFKKDYFYEICNIFEDNNFKEIGKLDEKNCKYNNLIDIYNEWKVK